MTLRELRDRLSALQALIASAAVLAGGGMSWTSLGLALAFGALAFYRPRPEVTPKSTLRIWTVGIVFALVATFARVLLVGDLLDAGVDFLLLMIVQRLFNRQKAREHMQLLMLGSLMMVVGAVVNTGLTYPVLFAAYTVIAVMTLVVNHLMSEGERLGVRVMAEMARAAMRSRKTLWRAASGVAALAGVGALLVFLLFPRWGAGVFLRGAFSKDSRSGFAGEVTLGDFGRIKSDATVAARLRPKGDMPRVDRLTWHLRGGAFDIYQDGRWSNNNASAERVPLRRVGQYRALAPNKTPLLVPVRGLSPGKLSAQYEALPKPYLEDAQQIHVDVMLEDLGVDAMFVASDPVAVRVSPRGALEQRDLKVRPGLHREFRIDKPPGPVQYEFVAQVGTPNAHLLRGLGDPEVDEEFAGYLRRTEGLSPEVLDLAQQLTNDATNRYDKVLALMGHLGEFGYTTDLESSPRVRDGADPLEGFLFDTQTGHCEYFATALAVLGREVGIPTRLVNGYYGAHYNALGDFYAVRQADAHSWVEVWFGPEAGWITFDPTPPSGRVAGDDAPLIPALNEAFDALRNAYLEYVIDYNLTKQLSLLEGLGMRSSSGQYPRVQWRGVAMWGGGAALVLLAVWLWRRRSKPKLPEAQQLYAQVLKALARHGMVRDPTESPKRFAQRVSPELEDGAPLLRFVAQYDEIRFGRESADLSELRRCASGARDVRPRSS
ncbi:MAG: transglutaminase TgpA family protein [Nannocystales bacterium]